MYSPDTLKRLNDEAVAEYQARVESEEETCDYCNEKAVEVLPIYNPADALREPPVEGAYSTLCRCEEHRDEGWGEDDIFFCPDCGEWYIVNHSWDIVAVMTEDGYRCQKCAAESLEGVQFIDLLDNLRLGRTSDFLRINGVPGKEKLWEGEFSQYSDFPGFTNLSDVADAIEAKAEGIIGNYDKVYPIIDHGYQFSVSLAVYK